MFDKHISEIISGVPLKFILPVILLGVQFSFKFFIDRRANAFNFITSILEIPVNVLFITSSLLAGFIIAGYKDLVEAFILFLLIIPVQILCIFFWRRSVEFFEKEHFYSCGGLGILNFFVSFGLIFIIIYRLTSLIHG